MRRIGLDEALGGFAGRVSVMEPKLRDQKRIVLDAIDDTVLSGYPSRPETGQSMLQSFGFSYSRERISLNLPDQSVDPLDHPLILLYTGIHNLPAGEKSMYLTTC